MELNNNAELFIFLYLFSYNLIFLLLNIKQGDKTIFHNTWFKLDFVFY